MKFIKYSSKGNTVGLEENILSYWELDQEGYIVRCIEELETGEYLKYSESHEADSYGQLPEGITTEDNLGDKKYGSCVRLTKNQFEKLWLKMAINYNQ